MLYEIINEDRQFNNFENILLEHEKVFTKQEFQGLIREANYNIEEFITETYDEYNETMMNIKDTWQDYSSIIAIADWLCEYKEFSRYKPQEKISGYIDG